MTDASSAPLKPGATVGILGGGQLARMLSVAASRLGFRSHIFEPGPAPAGDVAHAVTAAPYDDTAALQAFAAAFDRTDANLQVFYIIGRNLLGNCFL